MPVDSLFTNELLDRPPRGPAYAGPLDAIQTPQQLSRKPMECRLHRLKLRVMIGRVQGIRADFQVKFHQRRVKYSGEIVVRQMLHSLDDPLEVSFLELDGGVDRINEILIALLSLFPIRQLGLQRAKRAHVGTTVPDPRNVGIGL